MDRYHRLIDIHVHLEYNQINIKVKCQRNIISISLQSCVVVYRGQYLMTTREDFPFFSINSVGLLAEELFIISSMNRHNYPTIIVGQINLREVGTEWTFHYSDVIMSAMASQILRLTIVYLTVYSGTDQIKHQNSASLAFVRGIHRWSVNSPHKGSVTSSCYRPDVLMHFVI